MTTESTGLDSPQEIFAAAVLEKTGFSASPEERRTMGEMVLGGLLELQETDEYLSAVNPSVVIDDYFEGVIERLESGIMLLEASYISHENMKWGTKMWHVDKLGEWSIQYYFKRGKWDWEDNDDSFWASFRNSTHNTLKSG